MQKLNDLLTKTSSRMGLTILTIITILNFGVIGMLTAQIGTVSGGETLLDFSVGHTQASVTSTLSNYGSEGIALYRWVERIDLVHPFLYSLLLASLFFSAVSGNKVWLSGMVTFRDGVI